VETGATARLGTGRREEGWKKKAGSSSSGRRLEEGRLEEGWKKVVRACAEFRQL